MNQAPFTAQANAFSLSSTDAASASTAMPNIGNVIRIVNEGPNNAYVSIGTDSQTATLPSGTAAITCTPVMANTDVSLAIPNSSILNISSICRATQTATLVIQVGEGM